MSQWYRKGYYIHYERELMSEDIAVPSRERSLSSSRTQPFLLKNVADPPQEQLETPTSTLDVRATMFLPRSSPSRVTLSFVVC